MKKINFNWKIKVKVNKHNKKNKPHKDRVQPIFMLLQTLFQHGMVKTREILCITK